MDTDIPKPDNSSFPVRLVYNDGRYEGEITPIPQSPGVPTEFRVVLNGTYAGRIRFEDNKWQSDDISETGLIDALGRYIREHRL